MDRELVSSTSVIEPLAEFPMEDAIADRKAADFAHLFAAPGRRSGPDRSRSEMAGEARPPAAKPMPVAASRSCYPTRHPRRRRLQPELRDDLDMLQRQLSSTKRERIEFCHCPWIRRFAANET